MATIRVMVVEDFVPFSTIYPLDPGEKPALANYL
jgi:hypothetical protein